MLRIQKLSKTYKTKSGLTHQALKEISLDFGEKGFVFILGKSGCGKSTLLNVLGGLDQADAGELVINGKTSEDFKAKDWDSYRNTYLGFIFQEFNIIENYTVAKNVALALELQGLSKKEIREQVGSILEKVDLKAYGKRKPYELSGGQKQRIAIARALVKNPSIILADEPTGNLDQETGEQILGILRKLADEKLVIMVSHAKDSAYKYADRIITMNDGKVMNDELNDGGLKYISDKIDIFRTDGEITRVIRVPKGEVLTAEEIRSVNIRNEERNEILYIPLRQPMTEEDLSFINKKLGSGDISYLPIATEVDKIQGTSDSSVKNRINPQTERDSWLTSKFRLIKSKLPFNNSLKMAFSAIWRKKFKLLFSSVLFLAALSLFGFSETITQFDFSKAITNSYTNGNINKIAISNQETVIGWEDEEQAPEPFSKSAVEEMISKFDRLSFGKEYDFTDSGITISNGSLLVQPKKIVGFLELTDAEAFDLNLIEGSFPKTDEEIALTDYVGEYIVANDKEINSYEDLLNKPYYISGKRYRITGILGTDSKDFLYLNDIPKSRYKDMTSVIGTFNHNEESLYSRIIINEGFYDKYASNIQAFSRVYTFCIQKPDSENPWDNQWLSDSMAVFDEKMLTHPLRDQFLYVPDNFNGLKENEMIVTFDTLANVNFIEQDKSLKKMKDGEIKPGLYAELLGKKLIPDGDLEVFVISEESQTRVKKLPMKVAGVIDFNRYKQLLTADYLYEYIINHGAKFSQRDIEQFKEDFNYYYHRVSTEYMRIKINEKGIPLPTESEYYRDKEQKEDYWKYVNDTADENDVQIEEFFEEVWMPLVVSNATFNKINPYRSDKVQEVLIALSEDANYNNQFFNYTEEKGYRHETLSGKVLNAFNDFVEGASSIFRYISLTLAAFSVLLMFTNISSSVMSAKKEIGTLRAIGARGNDVATIFVTEALIIALIISILANIALIITTGKINQDLSAQIGISMALFNPSTIIGAEIFGLAALVVLAAAYVPVKGVSIMKPIDAIKK